MALKFLQDSDSVLDQGSNHLSRSSYMHIDRFSGQIYKFMADDYGYSSGTLMASLADPSRIKYETVKQFPKLLHDHFLGIPFCGIHNLYIDKETFISPCEKYAFFKTYEHSYLHRLDTMKLIEKFDYEYVSNYTPFAAAPKLCHFMLSYAKIAYLRNDENTRKLSMIKVLFICHVAL